MKMTSTQSTIDAAEHPVLITDHPKVIEAAMQDDNDLRTVAHEKLDSLLDCTATRLPTLAALTGLEAVRDARSHRGDAT